MMKNGDSEDSSGEYESVDDNETREEPSETAQPMPTPPSLPPRPIEMFFPSAQGIQRDENPDLSKNVTLLTTDDGCKVYLVGTAHFSKESQDEVIQVIRLVKPDIVAIELCKGRVNILQLDEKTLLEEAQTIDMSKFRLAVKQSGLVQGVMHLLLLSMSAHLTKELGMAPGGEFRVAVQHALQLPGCRVDFIDRPIQITFRRAIAGLSWWQFIRIAWCIITSKQSISKEDVERCKDHDLLEELLREMTGEFPALSRVFVSERDLFLARRLRDIAKPVTSPITGLVPSVTVAVVGIGHTPGMIKNWSTIADVNLPDLMTVPKPSPVSVAFKWTFRVCVISLLSLASYKTIRWTSSAILS